MQTNGQGPDGNKYADFSVYDRLPPILRRAIQDMPINFGARSAQAYLYKYDSHEVAQIVTQWMQQHMRGNDPTGTKAQWAKLAGDHPQADPAYPWPDYQLTPMKRTEKSAPVLSEQRRRDTRFVRMKLRNSQDTY